MNRLTSEAEPSDKMSCRSNTRHIIEKSNFVCTKIQYLEHFYSQIIKSRSLHSLVYMVTGLEVGREEFWLGSSSGLLHFDQIASVIHFAFRRMGIVLRGRCFKIITYFYLESSLRMRGVIPSLPHTYSWRCACG
jgi:hypothetical protein